MQIISKIITREKPAIVLIEPHFGCNLKCFFCLHGKGLSIKKEKLQPEIFEKIKPVLSQAQIVHIAGWGEPFLNEHLYDYLEFLKNITKPYLLISNGTVIKRKYLPLLVSSYSHLAISTEAGNEETYRVSRGNNNWPTIMRTLAAINALKREKASRHPVLELKIHLNGKNIGSLPDLPGLCRQGGINRVTFGWTMLPEQYGMLSTIDNRDEHAAIIQKTVGCLESMGIEVTNNAQYTQGNLMCWNARPYTFIGANGSVAGCCHKWITYGNLSLNSFDEIWNSTKHREIRFNFLNGTPIKSCSTCMYYRDIDYARNKGDFIKEKHEEENVLLARAAKQEKHPNLNALFKGFEKGVDCLKEKNTAAAIDIFSSLAMQFPDFFEVWHNLAVAYQLAGDSERCLRSYLQIKGVPYLKTVYDSTMLQVLTQDPSVQAAAQENSSGSPAGRSLMAVEQRQQL